MNKFCKIVVLSAAIVFGLIGIVLVVIARLGNNLFYEHSIYSPYIFANIFSSILFFALYHLMRNNSNKE